MAVSVERAHRHVAEWRAKLARFPARRKWPECLYHACQIEVAAEILRRGELLCRSRAQPLLCDVANQGALWNNLAAHDYVRLYFRPRNQFHLKTEGIKSRADTHRVDPHMSIPVMLAFDAASVLALPESMFVPGNFAGTNRQPLSGDAAFDDLNFGQIYHESPISRDEMHAIQDARMSEVVVGKSLDLKHLVAVVTRTIHEERYLRSLLGPTVAGYRFAVEKHGSVFFRRAMFIREIYTQDGELHFEFKAPHYGTKAGYEVVVSCGDQRFGYELAAGRWRIAAISRGDDPAAVWRIEIEGCVAYEDVVPPAGPVVR
jgi:hypothetical protein